MSGLILPIPNAILPILISQRDELLAHIDTLEGATSVENVDKLNRALTQCASIVKMVETYRKGYTAPLDEFKKTCMRQQEEVLEPIEAAIGGIKQELADYQSRVMADQRKRDADRAALEAAKTVATAGVTRHVTPALVAMEPAPVVARVNTRKQARLVVTDPSMIPHTFYDLNERKLLDWLRESPINKVLGAHYVMDDIVVTGRAT
jgi:hypothetical protein